MGKKKDNLRRGKRGPVPRFDYHVVFEGALQGVHQVITNVKDVLFLAWNNEFNMDSHVLNKHILNDGQAVFRRRDGSLMVVIRTPKHTEEEMLELYLSGTEADREYVDNYLTINPGLRRKISPQIKKMSGGELKLKKSRSVEEVRTEVDKLKIKEVEEAKAWAKEMIQKLKKR